MYKLYSKNNQIIVEENSSIIYIVHSMAARIQVIDNNVFMYDLFNKSNAKGHTLMDMGPVSNVTSLDSSIGFSSESDLYNYFTSICGTYNTDVTGNPSGNASITDISASDIIYEGYYMNGLYRICKITISATSVTRAWATGAWADRTQLTYI